MRGWSRSSSTSGGPQSDAEHALLLLTQMRSSLAARRDLLVWSQHALTVPTLGYWTPLPLVSDADTVFEALGPR